MMDITLGFLLVNAVESLFFAERAESCNGKDLGLTACEHAAAVGTGQNADFCRKRPNLVHLSSVNALLFIKKPASDNIFLGFIEAFVDFSFLIRIHFIEFFVDLVVDWLQTCVTHIFVIGIKCSADIVNGKFFDGIHHFFVRLVARVAEFLLADFLLNPLDERNDRLVCLMAGHNPAVHHVVRDFVGTGLNHGNAGIGGSNGNGHF